MQGVELSNRLLHGEPEHTIGIKYESTLDGRQAAKHERSHVAGSGDPKKMKELAELIRDTPGCVSAVVPIGNEAYNRLYLKMRSVNSMLASTNGKRLR